jgi:branched-chain amino acid transport system permease protein
VSVPVGQLVVAGVAGGSAYGLIAVGYSLVYRTSRAINFAQGDMAMLGAYLAFASTSVFSSQRVISIVLSLIAIAALSVVLERLAFRPLYRFGTVFIVASSIAFVFVLEDVMQLLWGVETISAPDLVGGDVTVAGITITGQQLVVMGVLALFLAALQVLFRSRLGIAMRGSAENADVAELLGVSSKRVISLSFAIAGAASAAGGILVAPLTQLRPTAGGIIGLTAVVAAIVGGLGSVPGAVLGALLIGLVQVWAGYLIGGEWSQIITFSILILVLLIRPSGLLGEEGLTARR